MFDLQATSWTALVKEKNLVRDLGRGGEAGINWAFFNFDILFITIIFTTTVYFEQTDIICRPLYEYCQKTVGHFCHSYTGIKPMGSSWSWPLAMSRGSAFCSVGRGSSPKLSRWSVSLVSVCDICQVTLMIPTTFYFNGIGPLDIENRSVLCTSTTYFIIDEVSTFTSITYPPCFLTSFSNQRFFLPLNRVAQMVVQKFPFPERYLTLFIDMWESWKMALYMSISKVKYFFRDGLCFFLDKSIGQYG